MTEGSGPSHLWEGRDARGWEARLGIPTVEVHASLGSTNDRVRVLAREAPPLPALVLAEAQTRGRGREGRSWISPPGAGVWMSLLLPSAAAEVDVLLPLRIGMMAAARLESASGARVLLKWPNDLFLDAAGGPAKVGGILCERFSPAAGSAGELVVAGLGVNHHPVLEGEAGSAAHLSAAGCVSRGKVLEALVAAVLDAREGSSAALAAEELETWRARDLLDGREVEVSPWRGGALRGVARGVDSRGRLMVDGAEGVTPVGAGSVRPLANGVAVENWNLDAPASSGA